MSALCAGRFPRIRAHRAWHAATGFTRNRCRGDPASGIRSRPSLCTDPRNALAPIGGTRNAHRASQRIRSTTNSSGREFQCRDECASTPLAITEANLEHRSLQRRARREVVWAISPPNSTTAQLSAARREIPERRQRRHKRFSEWPNWRGRSRKPSALR